MLFFENSVGACLIATGRAFHSRVAWTEKKELMEKFVERKGIFYFKFSDDLSNLGCVSNKKVNRDLRLQ